VKGEEDEEDEEQGYEFDGGRLYRDVVGEREKKRTKKKCKVGNINKKKEKKSSYDITVAAGKSPVCPSGHRRRCTLLVVMKTCTTCRGVRH
jgi:hypothetical protein